MQNRSGVQQVVPSEPQSTSRLAASGRKDAFDENFKTIIDIETQLDPVVKKIKRELLTKDLPVRKNVSKLDEICHRWDEIRTKFALYSDSSHETFMTFCRKSKTHDHLLKINAAVEALTDLYQNKKKYNISDSEKENLEDRILDIINAEMLKIEILQAKALGKDEKTFEEVTVQKYEIHIPKPGEKFDVKKLKKGRIYFENVANGIKYTVIDPKGKQISHTLTNNELDTILKPKNHTELNPIRMKKIEENFQTILAYTTRLGHTQSERLC